MITKEEAYKRINDLVVRFEEQLSSYKSINYNETLTRRDFIDPFFQALGWDVDNSQGYAEAYREVIHEDRVKIDKATKAPDYSFKLAGGKRLFFVEAKKPSVSIKDDISVAYQIRRYGWSAKLPVSIITDFEEFAVYDCTKKPVISDKSSVARIKYITYKQYLEEFEFLWDTFSKERVLKGSFDKFVLGTANKKGTATVDKEFLISLDNWRTYLATSISLKNKELDEEEINFVVQQTIDRIIFLRIAEDRSIETYGNLKSALHQGDYYQNLFTIFTEADQKYNSGLFDLKKDQISKDVMIENKVLKTVINQLYYPESPYEFSVLSVEILGSAYEQFLGKQIKIDKYHRARIEEKPEVRKAGGVYYTPQYVVEYIVKNTVGKMIEGKTPAEVAKITICDPACGSGSFLIGAYQYLLDWHLAYYQQDIGASPNASNLADARGLAQVEEMKTMADARGLAHVDKNSKSCLTPESNLTTSEKKRILLNNIYGVDIDVNAVEVTKLSLLLKCMEGETEASIATQINMFKERVLPTLDNNIKDGNSLIDIDYYATQMDFGEEKKIKPFSWQKAFAEVFKEKVINEKLEAFHITWPTYNSRPEGIGNYGSSVLLDGMLRNSVAKYLDEKIGEAKYRIVTLNILCDHVHCIVVCKKEDLAEIVRNLKGYSSYKLHRDPLFPQYPKVLPQDPTLKRGVDSTQAQIEDAINPMLQHGVGMMDEVGTTEDDSKVRPMDSENLHQYSKSLPQDPTLKRGVDSTQAQIEDSINPMLQHGVGEMGEVDIPSGSSSKKGESLKLWAKDYSHTFLNDEEHLLNAISYVENNHIKHNLPKLEYKFKNITPLSKAFEPRKEQGGFDCVIGNPPYIQSREEQFCANEKEYYNNNFKTTEYQINTFGLFIEKGTSLLKQDGLLGFIIPNYWLSTMFDKKLRKFIFQENNVSELINVYKVFEAAVVDTLLLIIAKGNSNKNQKSFIKSIDRNLKSIPERLTAINNNQWSYLKEIIVDENEDDIKISFQDTIQLNAKKLISDYFELKFGVKLYQVGKGKPAQTKSHSEGKVFESNEKLDTDYIKLLRARNIQRYFIREEQHYIKYGEHLAEPRNIKLFQGDRILLQRIVSKKCLDATYTDKLLICNTDVITLKPKLNINCKFYLGILGSKLLGNYIKSSNINLDRNVFPKINTKTLEDVPVPDIDLVDERINNEIISLVDQLLKLNEEKAETKLHTKISQIESKIDYCENRINQIVYSLYDLTEEEIKIVEGE